MTELSEARAQAEAALIEGDIAAEVGAPVTWGEVRALHDVIRALLAAAAPVEGDEREALARQIDPEAWRDTHPASDAFVDDAEAQQTYERFFWQAVAERRTPSLEAAGTALVWMKARRCSTPTEEDVERAARAIREIDEAKPTAIFDAHEDYMALARAALSAVHPEVTPREVRRNVWADGSSQAVYSDGSNGPWEPLPEDTNQTEGENR